jgi:hypothetical protein
MPRASALFLALVLSTAAAHAQVYRWVDAKGTVHYSNAPPPPGVKAVQLPIDAKPGVPSADSIECYTVRCQGERMEERLRRRDEAEAKAYAERLAAAPKPVRGMDFRTYTRIQRGMSEGELLSIAGEPDFVSYQGTTFVDRFGRGGFELRTWTYMPTSVDPFTTTVTLVGGRVGEIERVRRF